MRTLASQSQPSWQICDLNSPNGTYVNGKRIEGCQLLHSGDRIVLSQDGPEFIFECVVTTPSRVEEGETAQSESSNLKPQAPLPQIHPLPAAAAPVAAPPPEPSSPIAAPPPEPKPSSLAAAAVPLQQTPKSLWNLSEFEKIQTLATEAEAIRAVAFSPNRQILANSTEGIHSTNR